MEGYKIGDRVLLNESALSLSYIVGRRWYTNMYAGKMGTIIGTTADLSKLAIQFDDKVFVAPNGRRSTHDNGCHGRGKIGYCWYIPQIHVTLCTIEESDELLLLL